MAEKRSCLKCQQPIAEVAPTGRPPSYCGDVCRRAAEYELRRVNRHISQLEERLTYHRLQPLGRSEAYAERLNAEMETLEARLRELLAGGAA